MGSIITWPSSRKRIPPSQSPSAHMQSDVVRPLRRYGSSLTGSLRSPAGTQPFSPLTHGPFACDVEVAWSGLISGEEAAPLPPWGALGPGEAVRQAVTKKTVERQCNARIPRGRIVGEARMIFLIVMVEVIYNHVVLNSDL